MKRRGETKCCVCGSPALAVGVLVMNRATVLAAFPLLRPRKRFPLCHPCRRKVKWVEIPAQLAGHGEDETATDSTGGV
jgi:hypothetical protein